MSTNQERVEALKARVDAFRFDPNQKRDGHGRWADKIGKLKDKVRGHVDAGSPFDEPVSGKPKGGSVADTVNRAEKITKQEWDALPQADKDLMWEDVNDTIGDLPNARAARENLRKVRHGSAYPAKDADYPKKYPAKDADYPKKYPAKDADYKKYPARPNE